MIAVLENFKNKYKSMAEPSKASLWYTVCNVLLKGIALLTTPVFTRILTQEQYGQYALFQSWYSIISIFATLNLFQSVYSKGLLLYEKQEKQLTSALLGLSTTITIGIGLLYCINPKFWQATLDLSGTLLIAMFIELLVMSAFEFWGAGQRFEFKYKKYAIVTLLMSVFSIVFGIASVLLTDTYKVEARVFSDVCSKALFGAPLFLYIMKNGKCYFSKNFWSYALKFNLPLIPHFLSTFVLNQADRIMIGRMESEAKAAIYSIAYTISTMMLIVVTALNNALVPYIYKQIKAKEYDAIRNHTKIYFIIVGLLCIVTMVFAPEIIYIFAGKEYYEAIWIIPPIAVSVFFIFVYSMFSTIEYYFQKTSLLAFASFLCATINIILNYIFIDMFGYFAAGYTTLVSYILLSFFHYICYTQVIKKEIKEKIYLFDEGLVLKLSVFLMGVIVAMMLFYQHTIVRYALIGVFAIILVIKRKMVVKVVKGILSK